MIWAKESKVEKEVIIYEVLIQATFPRPALKLMALSGMDFTQVLSSPLPCQPPVIGLAPNDPGSSLAPGDKYAEALDPADTDRLRAAALAGFREHTFAPYKREQDLFRGLRNESMNVPH